MLTFNVSLKTVEKLRSTTAWTFIGALCDMFLTCMLWFILDNNKQNSVYQDRYQTYALIDIIKERDSVRNQQDS